MIDTDKYESAVYKVTVFLEDNEQYGDDWSKEKKELNDLLAEVKRLREWENRIRTYFGDEEMMDFYDWMKEKYGDEEE